MHLEAQPGGAPTRARLRGELGSFAFFAIAFGSMIGVGWVTALGDWLAKAGPGGAICAFLAGGAVMLLIGLCYAELTSMLPVAGGEIAYSYAAHGAGRAFLVGWFLAFGYLSVSAFEAISVARVAGYLWPVFDRWPLYSIGGEAVYAPHVLLGALLTGAITWLNYRGISGAARAQTLLTAAFLAATLALVGYGLIFGDIGRVDGWFQTGGQGGWGGFLAVFATAPFWFVGFDTIPQSAEEASESMAPRRLGLILLASIAAAAAFYALLILSVAMVGDWRETASAPLATAEAFRRALGSDLAADLVLIAALLGLLTSWNGFFLAAARVLFAMGRGSILQRSVGISHPRFGSPAVAVLWCGAATLFGALLGRGAMIAFVNVGSCCIGLAFLGVCLSAWTLRRRRPDVKRPYRAPGGFLAELAAGAGAVFMLGAIMLPFSPAALRWPLEWTILGALSACGAIAWAAGAAARAGVSESERAELILGAAAPEFPVRANVRLHEGVKP